MKVITQEEFDNLPRNEFGIKVVPAYSDLTAIREFGERCNFGEDCSFGKYCSFGEYCRFGECCRFGEDCSLIGLKILNYKAVDQIGKNKRKLYCWNLEGALYFQAGCFFGKKDELLERVDEEYGKDSEYHLAIEFLEKIITK
jgi:hypothetical protein